MSSARFCKSASSACALEDTIPTTFSTLKQSQRTISTLQTLDTEAKSGAMFTPTMQAP